MKNNISCTLKQLDQYTEYISKENSSDFRFQTTGQYGGIGASVSIKNDKIVVSDTYEKMPASLAGVIPGDEILSINQKDINGKTTSFVSKQLQGQPNTNIKLKYKRSCWSKPKETIIKRKHIRINPVTYYGILKNEIGYICLSSFSVQSALDIKKVLIFFKKNHPIKALIFDIRNNGGGIITECLEILNFFLPKKKLLLIIKGKNKQVYKTFYTTESPIEPDLPLVILVNENSASASEILSGAIQDTDRGIIVGTNTYGKGTVQSTYQLPYGTQLKLTTAKYYIPSGRCIQSINCSNKNEKEEKITYQTPNKLVNVYYTDHNRPVIGGKGILPDIIIKEEKIPAIVYYMETNFTFFDFAVQWKINNHKIISPLKFILKKNIYDEFKKFIKTDTQQNLNFKQKSKKVVNSLKNIVKSEGYYDKVSHEFQALETKLNSNLIYDLDFYKSQIIKHLAMHIIKQYYFSKGQILYKLQNDSTINKAIEVLQNKKLYNTILNIK
jgi:carboxyl-terminal processing protease